MRTLLFGLLGIYLLGMTPLHAANSKVEPRSKPMLGMYIHQHWAYNHPYAARTWNFEDWQGYLRGLHALGFNMVTIWPMLEIMPDPLLPSDREHLEKLRHVIDFARQELGFKVILVLCGNVAALDAVASRQSFFERNFFYCDYRFDPADKHCLAEVVARRGRMLEYLKAADGVAVIDGDPAGYPDATDAQFIDLLVAHRAMLDQLRPGMELLYWVNTPWAAYNRFYATGKFAIGSREEFIAIMRAFKERRLEPYGYLGNAGVLEMARELGESERFINLTYGVIEGEPTFPKTNFTVEKTAHAAGSFGGRGSMGNAQSHMLQLSNTFAFARGAQGLSVTNDDLTSFAEQLIPGHGADLLLAWQAMEGNSTAVKGALGRLEPLLRVKLAAGPLKGLIFNDPQRYVEDLVLQLRLRAAYQTFLATDLNDAQFPSRLAAFTEAAQIWQYRHGYANRWVWPELVEKLKTVDHPAVRAALADNVESYHSFTGVNTGYFREETATPRLLRALQAWSLSLKTGMHLPADGGIPQRRPD